MMSGISDYKSNFFNVYAYDAGSGIWPDEMGQVYSTEGEQVEV